MTQSFNSHDKSLFQKTSGLFTQDLQIYLSDFDFGNTGNMNILEGLFEFSHYADTMDNTFIDIDDDFLGIYINLKEKIKFFLHTFSINTTPTGNKMFEVASQKDWDFGDYDRYRKEANDINTSARNLFEAMKVFIINGKQRMLAPVQQLDEEFTTRSFNKLFNKINIQDTAAYFSGPRFFKIVNEFDSTHPDYYQYIEERQSRKLSTTRKVIFKDVLDDLDDEIRDLILAKINQVADEEEVVVVENKTEIASVYESNKEPKIDTEKISVSKNDKQIIVKEDFIHIDSPELLFKTENVPPKVFISYSWDDEEHKNWVLKLSKDLRARGIETILDRYSLTPGKNAAYFMEESIDIADKVLIIFTENYKNKASSRQGGVGIEYSILNTEISDDIVGNDKYIPILRKGSAKTSIPPFIRQYIGVYMIDDSGYEKQIKELVHSIFNKPIISIPEIGPVPDYITQ